MPTDHRAVLAKIKRFDQLIAYLRDEIGWPISQESFEELTFEYTPEELGIDAASAAKIQEIKRLRPLSPRQPWGIFFIKFEPKKLPIVALRRILSQVALKKRASANSAERTAWAADDLLFVSNYGEGDERQISFAHFSQDRAKADLPILKVLGWNDRDTALHLDGVATELATKLSWPEDESNIDRWREKWRSAFTLRPDEVIKTSKALAVELAKLARRIRDRIHTVLAIETEHGPVTKLRKAFQEALIHDLDDGGFADMYAQTIAYGLLSARIADPHKKTVDDFAGHMRTNPFLKELMETFLHVGGRRGKAGGPGIDFDELGVNEVVELLDDPNTHMEAVVRDFGDRNPQEDPVIHFYELFLKEYDAKKRMQRGVFYTPRPVVSYIVRSVDELLRSEFGLTDGLADITTWGEMARRHKDIKIPEGVSPDHAFVQILDPATGTGTFLVEAIDLIHKTLLANWNAHGQSDKKIEALWNEYVPRHLLPRLHGYELLMAPYAIAHLKIGLKLYETGYRFGSDERARVYLTNALEPASSRQLTLDFLPALAHEAQAVNEIKRKQRFTVVIGNPPYAKLSQNQGEWIDSLMERYKTTIKTEEIQRQALSNDYVKFMCLASTILESAGSYVLGMITDNSYLDGPLFRDMRADLMGCYRVIRLTDLGGNSRRVDATAADQNVFDIQQGVAIFLGSTIGKTERLVDLAAVRGSRDEKALWLASSRLGTVAFERLSPIAPQRYFQPTFTDTSAAWESWLSLPDVFAGGIRSGRPLPFNGAALATRHDSLAIAFTRAELRNNLEIFFDKAESRRSLGERFSLCSSSHFDFDRARAETTLKDAESCIRPILYRPFDMRYVVYHPLIIGEPRQEVMKHLLAGSLALLSTRRVTGKPYDNVLVCRGLVEYKAATHDRNTQVFPLYLTGVQDDTPLFKTASGDRGHANIAPAVYADWTSRLDVHTAEEMLYTIYAVLFSPEYRRRFQGELQRDYARVPRPSSPALNRELIQLGSTLVALHLMDSPKLDHLITNYSGPKNPEVGRVGWSEGTVWLDATATKKGQPATPGTIGFCGVPGDVWNFHVGGYQVCEKWLKDRKGRTLSKAEIAHYQKIVVALAETIRLMQKIDEVIEQHGGWPGAFQIAGERAAVATASRPRPVKQRAKRR